MADPIFTHDSGVEAFADASGAADADGDEISFDWDEQHIVTVDAPADLEGSFDTDQFYKIEDATIARPIKQPYLVGDDVEWYKKPADELRKAAWSFDNAPFTLSHPDTGMVKDVEDVHGFWRNARYLDDEDRLVEDLYIPSNDDEALEWIEENSDVSVGFFNRVASEYDGDTGDLTDDDVDGFQVDMYGNHIAGVESGRCSGEDGCGLDSQDHGVVVEESTETHNIAEDDLGSDESTDDAAESCGCNNMGDDNGTNDGDFEIPDLSVDALAEKNDAVSSLKAERDELESELQDAEETITDAFDEADHFSVELDEDECACEAVEDLVADLDEKAEEVETLSDELSEYREEEKEEALDELTEFGADREDWADEDLDDIRSEIDRREEVADDLNVSTKHLSGDSTSADNEGKEESKRSFGRGHAV